MAGPACGGSRAPHVDGGEQEQPDTSTKCQYQAAASKPKCSLGVKRPHRPDEANQQEDGADRHVRAVEARRHEERRAVDVAGVAEGGVVVLVGLEERERGARMTVRIRPSTRPRRSFFKRAWCAQVTVTPEVNRMSVLSRGTPHRSNVAPGTRRASGRRWPGWSRRCRRRGSEAIGRRAADREPPGRPRWCC